MASQQNRARGPQQTSRSGQKRGVSRILPIRVSRKGKKYLRTDMPARRTAVNEYSCAMEKSQNGKYNVRIRGSFHRATEAQTGPWQIHLYFLASSFTAAMKKLEESLQTLQKNEERLRFWGVERTDDPSFAGEIVRDYGLRLDRRRDYPRKVAEIVVGQDKPVPASQLAQIRRALADSVAQERFIYRAALAGD